jgi:hypothetical protein
LHGGLGLQLVWTTAPLGQTSRPLTWWPWNAIFPQHPLGSFLKHVSSLNAGASADDEGGGPGSGLESDVGPLPGLLGLPVGSVVADVVCGAELGVDAGAADAVLAIEEGSGAPVAFPIGSYVTGGRLGGSAHAAPHTTTSMATWTTLTDSKD